MEGVANTVEDRLVDGLSFQLKPGASYVTERKSVTFHPQGSNIYSTQGTKLIKLLLTGDQWLDPTTFRIMFDLQNNETLASNKLLRPLGGPHTFIRRMRILANGAVIEDIDNYNRVHEMFKILNAEDTNKNNDAEAFGQQITKYTNLDTTTVAGILGGQSQTVLFKPCSGLFNQPKMLPIRYMPITIELEIVHDNTEPVVSETTNTANNFDLANIIPPQRAPDLLKNAGLVESQKRWASVNSYDFSSKLADNVYIIGDATDRASVGSVPKSGYIAYSMGKVCGYAVHHSLIGSVPPSPSMINTCYSLVSNKEGISVSAVYRYNKNNAIFAYAPAEVLISDGDYNGLQGRHCCVVNNCNKENENHIERD